MRAVILAAIAAVAVTMPSSADQCATLTLLTSVQLQPAIDGNAELVPVELGGVPKLMVLDTGAELSLLSTAVVKELGLETRRVNVRSYALTGNYSDRYTTTSLTIGRLKGDRVQFMTMPSDFVSDYGKDVVGLLGADILGHYDVSVDFGTHKLDLLDQNHCEGKVVYWPARPVAVVSFKRIGTAQIVIPVTLDGHEMQAYVDTGSAGSTIRQPRAELSFGIKVGSADTPQIGDLNNDKNVPVWRHVFKSLTLEGVSVSNPEIDVIPDRLSEHLTLGAETGTRFDTRDDELQPDILLGMNVLKHLHVYIAYQEKKLYITPADDGPKTSAN